MTKLQTLKKYLAYIIEHKDKHDWGNPANCHCGMLLKSTNLYKEQAVNQAETIALYMSLDGYYKSIFNMYKNATCDVTNLLFTEVVNELVNKGFKLDELINLEYLTDKRFNNNVNGYHSVRDLISYLNNWISYEEQVSVKQTTKSVVPVSV